MSINIDGGSLMSIIINKSMLIIGSFVLFLSSSCFAQQNSKIKYAVVDSFLEMKYANSDFVTSAIDSMTSQCVAISLNVIDSNTIIREIGVGDSSGQLESKFSVWNNVGTIKGFVIPKGGVHLFVRVSKTPKNENGKFITTVGFKIEGLNPNKLYPLHNQLKKLLVNRPK
jgi:hypothetical protein